MLMFKTQNQAFAIDFLREIMTRWRWLRFIIVIIFVQASSNLFDLFVANGRGGSNVSVADHFEALVDMATVREHRLR